MARKCIWRQAGAARGVIKSSCSLVPFLGVPAKPGTECPYCGREVAAPKPSGKPATLSDYQQWKASQLGEAGDAP